VLAYSSSASEDEKEDNYGTESPGEGTAPLHKRPRPGSDSEASAQSEDEDAGGWGASKRDYYNADAIETEADALEEEAEARRLQQKKLQGMSEADFGFDETEWLHAEGTGEDNDEDGDYGGVVTEVLPQLEVTEDMKPEDRIRIIRTRYPEFELLSKEFLGLQPMHRDLAIAAAGAEAIIRHDKSPQFLTGDKDHTQVKSGMTSVATIKFRALSAYLGALSMYFALLTSSSKRDQTVVMAMPPAELRDHGVMDSLVKCQQVWEKVKDLRIPDTAKTILNGVGVEEDTKGVLDPQDKLQTEVTDLPISHVAKRKKKTKAQRIAEAAQAEAEARRAERAQQVEEELATLSHLTNTTSRRKPNSSSFNQAPQGAEGDSDFGEETTLTPHEAAEKAKRKKSLRFYTSQIAQKANKRDAAGRDAGGDADLPYRERLRDRQARMNAEAEARGKHKGTIKGAPLGGDSDEEDGRVAMELRDEGGSEDDYYDMIAARSKEKKAEKKELADAHRQALESGGRVEIKEELAPDGKRAIGYTIEKNKGLAPKRKKDVRNPRVKKRKKYEEKKKKLGSMRQVYRGGEGKGGYGGELTGIKRGLVRSVKL